LAAKKEGKKREEQERRSIKLIKITSKKKKASLWGRGKMGNKKKKRLGREKRRRLKVGVRAEAKCQISKAFKN